MVSLIPFTQNYVEEPESCFMPSIKNYRKGSLMDTLMVQSPIFAYLAQVGLLDDFLDSEEFHGTCFAPCEEYCRLYFRTFKDKVDHLRARQIVLSSLLRNRTTQEQLFDGYQLLPTLDKFNNLTLSYNCSTQQMMLNGNLKIVHPDIQCTNGTLHLINGLIDPLTRV